MDIMDMAAAVSLSDLHNEISGVVGPFYGHPFDREFTQQVVIWLMNGYGVVITKGNSPMHIDHNPSGSETAELLVVRKVNAVCGRVHDYDNPVTTDVLRSVTTAEITEALRKLAGLTNDPDDLEERMPPDWL
jgi:hypothetical protein